ncbi:unnamed protein product, partial [Ectocarpus sp. 12 AP-2014]
PPSQTFGSSPTQGESEVAWDGTFLATAHVAPHTVGGRSQLRHRVQWLHAHFLSKPQVRSSSQHRTVFLVVCRPVPGTSACTVFFGGSPNLVRRPCPPAAWNGHV